MAAILRGGFTTPKSCAFGKPPLEAGKLMRLHTLEEVCVKAEQSHQEPQCGFCQRLGSSSKRLALEGQHFGGQIAAGSNLCQEAPREKRVPTWQKIVCEAPGVGRLPAMSIMETLQTLREFFSSVIGAPQP